MNDLEILMHISQFKMCLTENTYNYNKYIIIINIYYNK